MSALKLLSSLKFTLLVMAALAIAALFSYKNPAISTAWIALPLSILAINLLVVIFTNPVFRKQYGLLFFHIGLLAVILLALSDQLTRFQGRLEITEGQEFDPAIVSTVRHGPLHQNQLHQIEFLQSKVKVEYSADGRRGNTRSQIRLPAKNGEEETVIIGDRQAWEVQGYRFLSTFNKGFAVILSWQDEAGNVVSGAVNMPSYPLNEWKQENLWITPGGQQVTLSFDPGSSPEKGREWQLETERASDARLTVITDQGSHVLKAGDNTQLNRGSLTFETVRLWMGYRIDYQPWLFWQFIAAVLAIVGLGFHFWQKFSQHEAKTSRVNQSAEGLIHSA